MKFQNCVERRNCISDFKSRCGEKIEKVYGLLSEDPDDVGVIGETDTDARIQSHAEDTDIHLMVQRFIDGDPDAFSFRQGFYGDVSNVPDDPHVLKRMYNDALSFYENLPDDVKNKYSIDEFYQEFGSESFIEFMDSLNTVPDDVVKESEVDDNAE